MYMFNINSVVNTCFSSVVAGLSSVSVSEDVIGGADNKMSWAAQDDLGLFVQSGCFPLVKNICKKRIFYFGSDGNRR